MMEKYYWIPNLLNFFWHDRIHIKMVAEMFYLFADRQISLGVLSKFEGSSGDLAPLSPKDNHVVGREADWIQRIGPVLFTVKRKK